MLYDLDPLAGTLGVMRNKGGEGGIRTLNACDISSGGG